MHYEKLIFGSIMCWFSGG